MNTDLYENAFLWFLLAVLVGTAVGYGVILIQAYLAWL